MGGVRLSQAAHYRTQTVAPASSRQGLPTPNRERPSEHETEGTMIVASGITIRGEINNVSSLIIEGTVETPLLKVPQLIVAYGGNFAGHADVEVAEVSGTITGSLTARKALIVRNTGRIFGVSETRRLQVEDGGEISGRIEMLDDGFGSSRATSAKLVMEGYWQTLVIHLDEKPALCISFEKSEENHKLFHVSIYWPGWSSDNCLFDFITPLVMEWGNVRIHSETADERRFPQTFLDSKNVEDVRLAISNILIENCDVGMVNVGIEFTKMHKFIELWTGLNSQSDPELLTPEVGIFIEADLLREKLFQNSLLSLVKSTSSIDRIQS